MMKKQQMPTVDVLNKSIIGETDNGDEAGEEIQPPAAEQGQGNAIAQPVEPVEEKPLSWIQEMPEYPGGINALKKIYAKKIYYSLMICNLVRKLL
jgi:protein TonB